MVEGGRVKEFKNFVEEAGGGSRVEMKIPAQSGTNEGSERLGGGLLLQNVGGLLGGYIGREWREFRVNLFLADGDGFEKNGFTIHAHIEKSHFPLTTQIFLLDDKSAAFIEMAEDATAKFNFAGETAIDFGKAFLAGIKEQGTFHP